MPVHYTIVVLMSAPKVEMYIIAAVITMVIVLLLGLVLLIIIKIIM